MKKIVFLFALIVSALALQAGDYTIASFHAPQAYIQKAKGDNFSFTEPVLWVEIQQGEDKIIERTKGQSVSGNKIDFYFDKKISLANDKFPLVVKIFVGEKKSQEAAMRAGVGAAVGATVGAAVGGFFSGILSFGALSPAGAAGGAAIGAGIGATICGGTILTVKDAREVASFAFDAPEQFIGKHKKIIGNDIISDGQEIRLVIK